MGKGDIYYFIIGSSVVLQIISALIAARLLFIEGRRLAGLITLTVCSLMGFRRAVSFYTLYTGEMTRVDFFAEIIALIISLLIFIGMIYVTRLVLSEKRAMESLAAVVDSLPFDLFGLNRDGTYFLQNRASKEQWGDIVGKRPEDVSTDRATLDIWRDNNRRVFAGETVEGEIAFMMGGEQRCLYNIISPIMSGGQVGGIVGFNIDITERKQTEMELQNYRDHLADLVEERTREVSALNDQLRQSQKLEAVGLLAGGIAHDFSNILTTIKGSMYIIRKKLEQDSPLSKYAEQVLSSVGRANDLTQSLLAFSRKQAVVLKPLYVNEVIEKATKLLAQVLGEHIEIDVSLTRNHTVILADRNQMEQILLNLATNARDAMPEGGRLTIQTDVVVMDEEFVKKRGFGTAGKYVRLSVSDNGTGMDENVREKIFEPFFTTKELGKGSGLGLAVIYGIVRQHRGYIVCEPGLPQGTTFRIYLPEAEMTPAQQEQAADAAAAGGAETILVAEDDPDTRGTISDVLRLSGYTVLEARDGGEALRIHAGHKDRIDLALLDVRMPGMNGKEVYEAITRRSPRTAVLFMSGYTDDIIDSEGILAGHLNFISKAAQPEEIVRKIREVLDT